MLGQPTYPTSMCGVSISLGRNKINMEIKKKKKRPKWNLVNNQNSFNKIFSFKGITIQGDGLVHK